MGKYTTVSWILWDSYGIYMGIYGIYMGFIYGISVGSIWHLVGEWEKVWDFYGICLGSIQDVQDVAPGR